MAMTTQERSELVSLARALIRARAAGTDADLLEPEWRDRTGPEEILRLLTDGADEPQ